MELVLTRIAKKKTYTIGHLYIAKEPVGNNPGLGQPLTKGLQICDTLEPPVLEMKTTVSKEAVLRSPATTFTRKGTKLKALRHPRRPLRRSHHLESEIQDVAPCASRWPRLQPSFQGHPHPHGKYRQGHRRLHPRRPQPTSRQSARIPQMALRAQAENRRSQG